MRTVVPYTTRVLNEHRSRTLPKPIHEILREVGGFLSRPVISSKLPTEMLFDGPTLERIREILIGKAQFFFGKNAEELLKKPRPEQLQLIMEFALNIVTPLHNIPHFLYNRIDFESESVGAHQSLFGTGYQHTFWTIIVVMVNETVSPETIVAAMKDNFQKEIVRLRSVIRHELTHRIHMETINPDPMRRVQTSYFQRAVAAPIGSSSYYGRPAEILAHANHTIELMVQGHEQGWREVLANYVLSDISPDHKNTKEYIRVITKLAGEYDVPLTKRVLLRRTLTQLTDKMHKQVPSLVGHTPLEQRSILARTGLSPDYPVTSRLHPIPINGLNGLNGMTWKNGLNGRNGLNKIRGVLSGIRSRVSLGRVVNPPSR